MGEVANAAQKIIAEVLRDALSDHAYVYYFTPNDLTVDGQVRPESIAAEIDAALGGLTRERAGRLGVTDHGRWISGWTEES